MLDNLPAALVGEREMMSWFSERTVQATALLGHRVRYAVEHDSAVRTKENGELCRVPLLIEGVVEGFEITGEGVHLHVTAFGLLPIDMIEDLGEFVYDDAVLDVAHEDRADSPAGGT